MSDSLLSRVLYNKIESKGISGTTDLFSKAAWMTDLAAREYQTEPKDVTKTICDAITAFWGRRSVTKYLMDESTQIAAWGGRSDIVLAAWLGLDVLVRQ